MPRSCGFQSLTALPTAAIVPEASWPMMIGGRRRPVLPSPLMLAVANPDGSPLPGLEECEEEGLLRLEPTSLVPAWFPHRSDAADEPLSPDQRRAWFVDQLNAVYQHRRRSLPSASDSALPAPLTSRQHLVLTSLLQLRSAIAPINGRATD